MNFIAQGGIGCKNVPQNTREAFGLALNTNYIEGIAIDLYMTADEQIVLACQKQLDGISNSKGLISNHTLSDLKKVNFGSKIKRHDIFTLEELLILLQDSLKMLVINLVDQNEPTKNQILVEKAMQSINKYPNVNTYLKSSNMDIVQHLNTLKTHSKIGITIVKDNEELHQYPLDFYSICSDCVSYDFIRKGIENHRTIMLEKVATTDELDQIHEKLETLSKDICIVSQHSTTLAAYYFMEIKTS